MHRAVVVRAAGRSPHRPGADLARSPAAAAAGAPGPARRRDSPRDIVPPAAGRAPPTRGDTGPPRPPLVIVSVAAPAPAAPAPAEAVAPTAEGAAALAPAVVEAAAEVAAATGMPAVAARLFCGTEKTLELLTEQHGSVKHHIHAHVLTPHLNP